MFNKPQDPPQFLMSPETAQPTEPANQNEQPASPSNSDDLTDDLEGVTWVGPDDDAPNEFVLTAEQAAEQEAEQAAEQSTEEALISSENLMTRAMFFETFRLIFDMPQVFDSDFAPLAIQPQEQSQAEMASNGVYTLLFRNRWTRKLLCIEGEFMNAMMQAGPFLFAKVQIVAMILRHKARIKAVEAQKPVNRPTERENHQSPSHGPETPVGDGFAGPVDYAEAA